MAAKFLSIDEAAKQLGISAEKLTELREKQMVRAFRDGTNWKFKSDDIEKLARDRAEIEDDSDSAEVILLSEAELGESNPGSSSTIIARPSSKRGPSDSDLQLGSSIDVPGASDIMKMPSPAANLPSVSDIMKSGSSPKLPSASDIMRSDSSPKLPSVSDIMKSDSVNLPSASDILKSDSVLGFKKPDSDVKLVASSDAAMGSDVKLVAAADSGVTLAALSGLNLGEDDSEFIVDAPKSSEDDAISIVPVLDDSSSLNIADDSDSVFEVTPGKPAPGSDLALPDDAIEVSMGHTLSLDDDVIPLAGEGSSKKGRSRSALDDDELVLGGGPGSDITINAGDSGISLADPADSGLSLELPLDLDSMDDEPLSLAGEDMLSIADDSDSEVVTEMKADSDFLLTPLEEVSEDEGEDSGSQVIALDDSSFGTDSGLGTGLDQMLVEDTGDQSMTIDPLGGATQLSGMSGVAVAPGRPMVPDITFTTGNIVALGFCVFFLTLTGMMMFDVMKNMWSWDGPYASNSAIMDLVLGFF